MKRIHSIRRLLAFALVVLLGAGVYACNEVTTTTQSEDLPQIDEVGSFEDYDDLQAYLEQFFAKNDDGWYYYRNGDVLAESATDAVTTTAAPGAPSGADDEVDRTHSVSNDQVEGVMETDTIMTDGYFLYVVTGDRFVMVDVDTMEIVFVYTLPEASWSYFYGMFLDEVNHKVVLLASEYTYEETKAEGDMYYYWYYYRYGTRAVVLDVSDATEVAVERELFFENTYLVDARMIGGQVYLVLDNYMINYGFDEDAFIPYYYDSAVSAEKILLGAEDIFFMPNDNYSLCYLMLVSFDVLEPETEADVKAYIGSTWQIYMSATNLYVIMYRYEMDDSNYWYDYTTFVLRFEIVDDALVFKAIGEIDGSPLNQFSMDEHDGAFRIATSEWKYYYTEVTVNAEGNVVSTREYEPGTETGDVTTTAADDTATDPVVTSAPAAIYIEWHWEIQNALFILDATTEGEMTPLGSITEGLGKPNERIYAVRFNGDDAYVVTFVNTDPLYKLDLSDPANPLIIGEYEEPGVSDYLHNLTDDLMIGVGREAVTEGSWTRFTGVKISLYDTSGDDPFATDDYFLESEYSYSPVTYDHKAFLQFQPSGADFWYVAIPVVEYFETYDWNYSQSLYVFKVHLDGELEFVAKLTHNDESTVGYYYYESIERAVIIGTHIYTVSYGQVCKFDMAAGFTLDASTVLNETPTYPYDYWR